MSVCGFQSNLQKSLKTLLIYLPMAGLLACGAGLAPSISPANPGGNGDPFSGGLGAVGESGGPGSQVTNDGVIRPVPGAMVVRVQGPRQFPSAANVGAHSTGTMVASQGDDPPDAEEDNTAGAVSFFPTKSGIKIEPVEFTMASDPKTFIMLQRQNRGSGKPIHLPEVFFNHDPFESLNYWENYFNDGKGHEGRVITVYNWKSQGEVQCREDVSIWACQVKEGKHYVSEKLFLSCPYGPYSNPLGTNPGESEIVLRLFSQDPAQACPTEPPREPVLDPTS